MEDIELEARRSKWGPSYDAIPQQDGGQKNAPANQLGDSDIAASIPHTELSPKSTSNSLLAEVEPQESTFKLPPKSYSQASIRQRIWKHVAIAAAGLVLIMIPLGLLIMTLYEDDIAHIDQQGYTFCKSNGLLPGTGLEDSFSELFNINVAFGTLSFGTAKIIDLIWDVGVSRGGQALLGWITYRVNTASLLRLMETQPVSYDLYSSLSFSWTTIASLVPVTKAFFTKLGFRRKLLILWLLLSIVWVAIWPTITNAMTGYIAENNTLVKLKNATGYGEFEDISAQGNLAFQFFNYTISSPSDRDNVTGPIITRTGPNTTLWNDLNRSKYSFKPSDDSIDHVQVVQMRNNIAETIQDYNSSKEVGYERETGFDIFYYYDNQTYYQNYFALSDNVQCVATGIYLWGFSITVTLIFSILNGVWVLCTYGLWCYMIRKSELGRKGRQLGKYRAALDVVESINRDLGKDICAYSEKELSKELAKLDGIQYYVRHGDGDDPSHIGISSRRRGDPISLKFGELYGHT